MADKKRNWALGALTLVTIGLVAWYAAIENKIADEKKKALAPRPFVSGADLADREFLKKVQKERAAAGKPIPSTRDEYFDMIGREAAERSKFSAAELRGIEKEALRQKLIEDRKRELSR